MAAEPAPAPTPAPTTATKKQKCWRQKNQLHRVSHLVEDKRINCTEEVISWARTNCGLRKDRFKSYLFYIKSIKNGVRTSTCMYTSTSTNNHHKKGKNVAGKSINCAEEVTSWVRSNCSSRNSTQSQPALAITTSKAKVSKDLQKKSASKAPVPSEPAAAPTTTTKPVKVQQAKVSTKKETVVS